MITPAASAIKYKIRKATLADCSAIEELIRVSAHGLGGEDYTPEQIEGALKGAFGVDTDLIRDSTYFVADSGGILVGCGGWSRRRKVFGGDKYPSQDPGELDPKTDSAKIRAFFVHPSWARKGIGRAILALCESEALANGFKSLELMATLPGMRFYSALGFEGSERINYQLAQDLTMEFLPMRKILKP